MSGTNTIDHELPAPDIEVVETGKAKRKLEPALKRNLMVIGGIFAAFVVLIVVFIMFRSGSGDKKVASVNANLRGSTVSSGNDKEVLSPAMLDALTKKQLDDQKKSADKGEPIFIPKDTLASPVSLLSPPKPLSEMAPVPQQAAAVHGAELDNSRNDRRRQGLERQLAQLLNANGDQGGASPQRILFDNKMPAGLAPSTAASGSGGAAATVIAKNLVVDGLEIVPAETASPIDTYRTRYASARIVAGKLAGAFLIGKTELVGEGLSTTYSMMRLNGKTYSVSAMALDEKTSTDAMAANIDHRYLQRYVMPVISAAIGGAATALAQTGSSVVATAGGVLGATPAPTTVQARAAGLAAGVAIAQQQINKEAQQPIQATLAAGSPIGILFLAPVESVK